MFRSRAVPFCVQFLKLSHIWHSVDRANNIHAKCLLSFTVWRANTSQELGQLISPFHVPSLCLLQRYRRPSTPVPGGRTSEVFPLRLSWRYIKHTHYRSTTLIPGPFSALISRTRCEPSPGHSWTFLLRGLPQSRGIYNEHNTTHSSSNSCCQKVDLSSLA